MQHTLQGRRALLRGMAAILACGTAPAAVRAAAPLKIGLLTPFSGPLARVAEANRNCLMMAVDEINAAGGLLGQALQIVSEDSQMSAKVSLDKARKLLAGDGVAMVTGMVLPFEREAVLQVASRYRRLVVYPNFDEGRCHPLLLTTGLASNQRVVPLIDWAVAQAGKSFFVLASDIGSNRSTLLPPDRGGHPGARRPPAGNTLFPLRHARLRSCAAADPGAWSGCGLAQHRGRPGQLRQAVPELRHEAAAHHRHRARIAGHEHRRRPRGHGGCFLLFHGSGKSGEPAVPGHLYAPVLRRHALAGRRARGDAAPRREHLRRCEAVRGRRGQGPAASRRMP